MKKQRKIETTTTWPHTAAFLRQVECALGEFLETRAPNQTVVAITDSSTAQNFLKQWSDYQKTVDKAAANLMSVSRHRVDAIASEHCDCWIKTLRQYSDLIQDTIELHAKVFFGWESRREWGGDDTLGRWIQQYAGIAKQFEKQRAEHSRQLDRDLKRHRKIIKDLKELFYRARGVGRTLRQKYRDFAEANLLS